MSDPLLAAIEAAKESQRQLAVAGFYTGLIDGKLGPLWFGALKECIAAAGLRNTVTIPEVVPHAPVRDLAWGKTLDRLPAFKDRPGSAQVFRDRIFWMVGPEGLAMPEGGEDDLMSCIAWESGETFSANVVNMAGSGATGLIQFMPTTAAGLGTSTAALARMTPEDQLNYVYRYFVPWKGKLRNLGDLYMAILWPLGVGKSDSFVLWDKGARPTTYRQNAGLDVNRDAKITRGEAVGKVLAKRSKGFQPENLWKEAA